MLSAVDAAQKPEIILNLWYVYDDLGFIYHLRARCYVRSGSDEEKLEFLRRCAETDYMIAQVFPIPDVSYHFQRGWRKAQNGGDRSGFSRANRRRAGPP